MPKKIPSARLYSKKKRGRPRSRWLDCIMRDLNTMKVKGWDDKARNRQAWRNVVEKAKTHLEL